MPESDGAIEGEFREIWEKPQKTDQPQPKNGGILSWFKRKNPTEKAVIALEKVQDKASEAQRVMGVLSQDSPNNTSKIETPSNTLSQKDQEREDEVTRQLNAMIATREKAKV